MTDIIKNHPDKDSAEVLKHCNANPQTIIDNVEVFREELTTLGGKPVIVAMGVDTYDILIKSNLTDDYEVTMINHYSAQSVKKDDLRQQVIDITNK